MDTTTTTWQLDPGVRFRRLFDEAVVIHQDNAEALVLNETGVSFLELCNGQRSLGEIISLLHEQYETGKDDLERDVARFVEELLASSVIFEVGDPAR
jgi:coenzyme PQQ biosynthesis protein PqqD